MNIFEGYAEHFERSMRDIWLEHGDDPEVCHRKMDELMCEILEQFGCEEGVQIFKDAERYYA